MSQRPLLIVESPSKARTIEQYLGGDYEVTASVGHVKDLPSNQLGVDIDDGFRIQLDVLPNRKQFITDLKKKAKNASRVLIATDPDREGEAIAGHLATEINHKSIERIEFTEITKDGISEAMNHIRSIDDNLVNAQSARRIIDRLVGYKISPVLWATLQKNMAFVQNSLSAGRVQSAAVKIIIDQDRLRAKFLKTTYFNLQADLAKNGDGFNFKATLHSIDERRIASSNDFDSKTGKLKNETVLLLSEAKARKLVRELDKGSWQVINIEEKPRTSNPKPPFTTSTLQQEAARKLRMSAKRTMRIAQQLYENGFITYMRTDSTHLSEEAIAGARSVISKLYGKEYLPKKQNHYKTKVRNAQEAHEAIRPSHREFKNLEEVIGALGEETGRLYDLIWKRTVASQMVPAKLKQTAITIRNQKSDFRARGQVIIFPGYMRVYVEGQDNPELDLANKERVLPNLSIGDNLTCEKLEFLSHTTKPPARFTEASLVKNLELNGIGRPSTFASILDTIVKRGYVDRDRGKLTPTYLGLAVTQLLENHFTNLVDLKFTAKMEEGLDEISRGERESLPFISNFYHGGEKFAGLSKMLEEKVDIPKVCTIEIPEPIKDSTEGRIGKYGPYLRRGEETKSIPEKIYIGDLTLDVIENIFQQEEPSNDPIGKHPDTQESVWIKKGPYGFYVQLGDTKTRKSIPKEKSISDINLDYALELLALPRMIGKHPETDEPIMADYGRYGPYIKSGKQNASLRGPETPLDISLDKSIELLANRNKKSSELKIIGKHPETGEDLSLKEGRYGPYVSDGKINAALKNEYSPETITLEIAVELINKRRLSPKKSRRRRKKRK